MLKDNGYAAYDGAFQLEIGTSGNNLENLVDLDPDNYASAAGIGATVALDQVCIISPDPTSEVQAPKYHGGDVIGFVLSDGSNSGSVLNLDVVKMFVIYLYNGKDLVATINAKGSELDVLGLSLVSFGAGQQTIKLPVPATDKDGNPTEFDGIGLGVAGVDASVLEQMRVNYAFVDCYEEVPIIKRYFKNSSASTAGMVTGGKNLTNNNLNDGATTAVLNIGGAYYNVYAGEAIPTGVEAGFTMTSGHLLNVDLGKAVQLKAIVKDADGKDKYINLTTGFDVVGLQLAGGGASDVCAMIPPVLVDEDGNEYTEFYGLRLERISGVDLDLGATVVHYAYVKLPKYPDDNVPFLANMYILPGAEYRKAGTLHSAHYRARETYQNKILIANSKEKPLLTEDKMPGAWRSGNTTTGSNKCARMSLFRSNITVGDSIGTPEFVGVIYIWHDTRWAWSDNKWHYAFNPESGSAHSAEIPDPDENGVVNFGAEELDLATIYDYYDMNGVQNDDIVGFCYWLYVHENDGSNIESMDDGYELDYTELVVPQIAPSYEIAGVETADNVKYLDTNDAPHTSVKVNQYKNYIEVIVPERVDYKTAVDGVTVYRHKKPQPLVVNHEEEEIYEQAQLTDNGTWEALGGNATNFGYVYDDGACKLVFGTEEISNTNDENFYTAVVSVKLTDEYANDLDEAFPSRSEFTVNANYGWVPSKAEEHVVPELSHNGVESHEWRWSATDIEYFLQSKANTNLQDAAPGHAEAGEILYSQWAKVSAADPELRISTYAVTEGQQGQTTAFNETFSDHNNSDKNHNPELNYTASDKSAHTATLHALHSTEGKVSYEITTRAYIPVLPAGFTAAGKARAAGELAPSYLVAENTTTGVTADEPTVTGVENVEINDEDGEAVYFNLQGVQVTNPESGHVYIMRRGAKATKVLVK
ncbi:MAG: hypothetical protein HDS69_01175 [Bacteroidales bacterium]|nr:hypothetical protein [Bacteroidales bacterium]